MEELLELRQLLLQGDIKGSLAIVDELEEMGRKSIEKNIRSHGIVLLMHLIKRAVEQRTTRSWDVSINNAVLDILDTNKRRKASGNYLTDAELKEVLEAAYLRAINTASLEISEGIYTAKELAAMVDRETIINSALSLISE